MAKEPDHTNILTANDLKELAAAGSGPRVSIYMPAHSKGAEVQIDPISLKNLLHKSEKDLAGFGLRSSEAQNFLKPAYDLLEDPLFWQFQSDGLALFISEKFFRYFRLPLNFKEEATVSRSFYIKPILPFLTDDGSFYILAMSKNSVKLLKGTRYSVSEVRSKDISESFEDALLLEWHDYERELQSHPSGTGRNPRIVHGQGGGEEKIKSEILGYFQKLDKVLREILGDKKAPLIFAGVEFLMPIFKKANTYPYLFETGLYGNPDDLSIKELHEKAWQALQAHFQGPRDKAMAKYSELGETDLVSEDIKEIVLASFYGKIETLLVASAARQWGKFDPESYSVELHDKEEAGDVDLFDFAAAHAFMHGGKIYALDQNEMPNKKNLAAVMRR